VPTPSERVKGPPFVRLRVTVKKTYQCTGISHCAQDYIPTAFRARVSHDSESPNLGRGVGPTPAPKAQDTDSERTYSDPRLF